MSKSDRILVAGAGGFIGGHLVAELLRQGHSNIRAVDLHSPFYAVQVGPLVQVPITIFWLTLKGGYQYSQTFHNGGYGGVELYAPF